MPKKKKTDGSISFSCVEKGRKGTASEKYAFTIRGPKGGINYTRWLTPDEKRALHEATA